MEIEMEAERNTLYVQYDDNGFFKIGPQIAFTYGETATDEANAVRIVACVNACEGTDNADLTHGCYQKLIKKHVKVHFEKQDLEAQRDKLLEALKVADCLLRGANMNRDEVELKVCAAIEIAENSRAKVAPPIQHPDDAAIDEFALAMKQKMQKKRNEGRSKWDNKKEIPALQLQCLLFESTQKGDPIDVANYAMMLWHRDELTTPDTTG